MNKKRKTRKNNKNKNSSSSSLSLASEYSSSTLSSEYCSLCWGCVCGGGGGGKGTANTTPVLSWALDGKSFTIASTQKFARFVLPHFFKGAGGAHSHDPVTKQKSTFEEKNKRIESFTRKCYRWGFWHTHVSTFKQEDGGDPHQNCASNEHDERHPLGTVKNHLQKSKKKHQQRDRELTLGHDFFQRDDPALLYQIKSMTAVGKRREHVKEQVAVAAEEEEETKRRKMRPNNDDNNNNENSKLFPTAATDKEEVQESDPGVLFFPAPGALPLPLPPQYHAAEDIRITNLLSACQYQQQLSTVMDIRANLLLQQQTYSCPSSEFLFQQQEQGAPTGAAVVGSMMPLSAPQQQATSMHPTLVAQQQQQQQPTNDNVFMSLSLANLLVGQQQQEQQANIDQHRQQQLEQQVELQQQKQQQQRNQQTWNSLVLLAFMNSQRRQQQQDQEALISTSNNYRSGRGVAGSQQNNDNRGSKNHTRTSSDFVANAGVRGSTCSPVPGPSSLTSRSGASSPSSK